VKVWENYTTDFCDRYNGPQNQKSNMNWKHIQAINALIFCNLSGESGLRVLTGPINSIYGTDSGTVLQKLP